MDHKRLQFKALSTNATAEQGIFEGHASVWDIVDSEGDIVERGAFAKTISEGIAAKGVPILVLHNDQLLPIGKTLALREDDDGLYVKGYISPTSMGNDVRVLIRDGVLDELSIGYIAIRHKMDGQVRRLQELELPEISVVTWAANSAAKITGYKGASDMSNTKQAPAAGADAPPEKSIPELLEEGNRLMAQLMALGCEPPANDPLAGKTVEQQMALLGVKPEAEPDEDYFEIEDDED